MVTGDHQLTAIAIARELGILDSESQAIDGRTLSRLSFEELLQTVQRVNVYARVAPEHKLRIVQALQKQNQFVAMTGMGSTTPLPCAKRISASPWGLPAPM